MRRFLEGKRVLEGGAYFIVDTQRCSAYQREALIWDPTLIRGNTVLYLVLLSIFTYLLDQIIWEATADKTFGGEDQHFAHLVKISW